MEAVTIMIWALLAVFKMNVSKPLKFSSSPQKKVAALSHVGLGGSGQVSKPTVTITRVRRIAVTFRNIFTEKTETTGLAYLGPDYVSNSKIFSF